MSAVSLPVTRPVGRALVVAHASGRASLVEMLGRLGFESGECEDPYSAALELTRRRLGYRALILSLASLFREELGIIATVKRRFPHIEIWLTHTDGRQALLAEAMRLGADGLLDDEGLHRIAAAPSHEGTGYHPMTTLAPSAPFQDSVTEDPQEENSESSSLDSSDPVGEPVLTADELRALLQDQPVMPPSGAMEEK